MPDHDQENPSDLSAKFKQLERQESALLADLSRAAPPASTREASAMADLVMQELEFRALLDSNATLSQTRLSESLEDDVMAAIESRSVASSAPRWLSYVSHAGVAVASLLFALVLFPTFNGEEEQATQDNTQASTQDATSSEPRDASDPIANAAAARTREEGADPFVLGAKVRDLRSLKGEQVVVIDAGLVEGLREGDEVILHAATAKFPLRIQSLSSWTSLATLPMGASSKVLRGDAVEISAPTDAIRDAIRRKTSARPSQGLFFGLGVVVEEAEKGLLIREVIANTWNEKLGLSEVTRARALGLQVGDRIQSVLGQDVRDDATLLRALAGVRVQEGHLVMSILRDGKILEVREQKASR